MIELVHADYLDQRETRREVHAWLRRISHSQGPHVLTVRHRGDGGCCRREPWARTAGRIRLVLEADGVPCLWVVA